MSNDLKCLRCGRDDHLAEDCKLPVLPDDRVLAANTPQQPQAELRECGNSDCGWTGTTERYLGTVGPLCPECGETTELAKQPQADNWQQYAKEGETAQQCIERHRGEQDALLEPLKQARAQREGANTS